MSRVKELQQIEHRLVDYIAAQQVLDGDETAEEVEEIQLGLDEAIKELRSVQQELIALGETPIISEV